jgi:FAD/FMN-containing dehydrogenase
MRGASFPADTAEVAAVVKACLEAGAPIVPQGGNTSLCGAATPDAAGQAVVVSLSRLNRIAAVDAKNNTISVGAGCTLAEVQAAAREVDRLFPLALASEGTCQIGGNLSTNAGGVQVLRYGNTRELTLGLEVVLPSGEIWDGLRGLRKDNTGYDLKQLFIGAEGTLGIITGAVLKLFPLPKSQTTCWLNVASPVAAVDLLNQAKIAFDGQLTAFELVSETALGLVLKNIPNVLRPASVSPWYVLAELSDTSSYAVEYWLHARLEAEEVLDAVIAQSETQAAKLWSLRENISEAQKIEGISIKHDVAVPVSAITGFSGAGRCGAGCGVSRYSGSCLRPRWRRQSALQPVEAGCTGKRAFHRQPACEVNRIVHDTVDALNGSISAEHGIGQLKREELLRYKSPVEMALMRSIKQALDPRGLMNPGKVL